MSALCQKQTYDPLPLPVDKPSAASSTVIAASGDADLDAVGPRRVFSCSLRRGPDRVQCQLVEGLDDQRRKRQRVGRGFGTRGWDRRSRIDTQPARGSEIQKISANESNTAIMEERSGRHATAVDVGCPLARKANLKLEQLMKALYILVGVAGTYLPTFAMAQVSLETLRACLAIEDQTKERLNCYDDQIKPAPKQVLAPAKTVQDCRFVKEEDERLNCFNRFVNPSAKKSTAQQKLKKPAAGTVAPGPAKP